MMNRARLTWTVLSMAAAGSFAFASPATPPTTAPVSSIQAPASTVAPSPIPVETAAQPGTYTTVKGDTLSKVAKKFGCSTRSLKKLNRLTSSRLKAGTELQIPATKTASHRSSRKSSSTLAATAKKPVILSANEQRKLALAEALKATNKYRRHVPVAQPVQDFDIPPSAFASCPPPPSSVAEQESAPATDDGTTAAIAPVPSQPADDFPAPLVATGPRAGLLPVPASLPAPTPPPIATPEAASTTAFSASRSGPVPSSTARENPTPVLNTGTAPKKSFASALADFFGGSHGSSESGEWGNRFLVEARSLAAQGVCYDGSWRPDGESHRWEMDCSNTTRYLYQVTAGIQLPRTASDQYYYLHLQDKAWDVPMTAKGFADCNFLRSNLKPGDLLFWENTYRPERQPPITHVMVFLGSDERGRWLMAGSQGSRGFYNRRHSGPDVYVFDPTHAVGGYTTWLGLVRHHGRFVAYGRPLEADVKKLSVATNN